MLLLSISFIKSVSLIIQNTINNTIRMNDSWSLDCLEIIQFLYMGYTNILKSMGYILFNGMLL
jgi:hypothetical protein